MKNDIPKWLNPPKVQKWDDSALGTYERLKQDWTYANPQATPEEYQRAMRLIAQEAGI